MEPHSRILLFPRLPAPCRSCRQRGLRVSATQTRESDSGSDGTMMLICPACGHSEFASIPARDMSFLKELAQVMHDEPG